jgi:hypothetical protein
LLFFSSSFLFTAAPTVFNHIRCRGTTREGTLYYAKGPAACQFASRGIHAPQTSCLLRLLACAPCSQRGSEQNHTATRPVAAPRRPHRAHHQCCCPPCVGQGPPGSVFLCAVVSFKKKSPQTNHGGWVYRGSPQMLGD